MSEGVPARMSPRFLHEIEKLKGGLSRLGAMVEESVAQATQAFVERDTLLAVQVVRGDYRIDQAEVDLEEECLKVLALYQPVASDLRFLVSLLRIDEELERTGDLAASIAERVLLIDREPRFEIPETVGRMAGKAQEMLRRSLEALVSLDSNLAYAVCQADQEVDDLEREIYAFAVAGIRGNLDLLEGLIQLTGVARILERIGDHATNIAEDVIYMATGDIVRHRPTAKIAALLQKVKAEGGV